MSFVNTVRLNNELLKSLECNEIKIEVLDSTGCNKIDLVVNYENHPSETFEGYPSVSGFVRNPDTTYVYVRFLNDTSAANTVVIKAKYLKDGVCVADELMTDADTIVTLLKYKVELPIGAKVTLFDDESLEAKYLAWNIPCPTTLPSMTFLQVKAANGFEQQLTPSAGSQTIELYMELGRRYAVFGEIWTYSSEQTLWFADLRVQLADDSWQDCIPTAGEGGTIVTALPQ